MHKIVIAATVKETHIDELIDTIDDTTDGDFDLVAWKRGEITRVIIWGPIRLRGVLQSEYEDFKLRPVGQLVEGMSDSRNKWIEPSGDKSFENADDTVSSWMREITAQFDSEEAPGSVDIEPDEFDVPMEEPTSVEIKKVEIKNKVLDLFGLSGNETDENGDKMNFFTYNVTEKEITDE